MAFACTETCGRDCRQTHRLQQSPALDGDIAHGLPPGFACRWRLVNRAAFDHPTDYLTYCRGGIWMSSASCPSDSRACMNLKSIASPVRYPTPETPPGNIAALRSNSSRML